MLRKNIAHLHSPSSIQVSSENGQIVRDNSQIHHWDHPWPTVQQKYPLAFVFSLRNSSNLANIDSDEKGEWTPTGEEGHIPRSVVFQGFSSHRLLACSGWAHPIAFCGVDSDNDVMKGQTGWMEWRQRHQSSTGHKELMRGICKDQECHFSL